MAKESLLSHRKFAHLVALLREPTVLVLGRLEMLYLTAHAAANPIFQDADELEACAQWTGEPGALAAALVRTRLVDRDEGGAHALHDYWDHAPRYVGQRHERQTAPNSAEQRRTAPNGVQCAPTDPDTDTRSEERPIGASLERERGGSPESAGEITARLLKNAAGGGQVAGTRGQLPNFAAWNDSQVLRCLVKLDRKNSPEKAKAYWRKRLDAVQARPGGAEWMRRALKHCAHATRQDRTDHGPPIANVAAYLNQQTRAWCAGEPTEIDR